MLSNNRFLNVRSDFKRPLLLLPALLLVFLATGQAQSLLLSKDYRTRVESPAAFAPSPTPSPKVAVSTTAKPTGGASSTNSAGSTAPATGCNPCFVFQPIEARQTPKDFSTLGVKPELNAALKYYQTAPSMKTAIGVLKFFTSDFYTMTADQRASLFKADPDLFLSVDIAKYEIVMHVRKEVGAKSSKRVGSTGQREKAIIDWVKAGRPNDGTRPILDPAKQFVSDDDVTNLTDSLVLLADEAVNGDRAQKVYLKVTRDKFGNEMAPDVVQTEFLSPTRAWEVFKKKYGDQISREHPVPDFLYAWVASNPEKYNDPFGVYMLDVWGYDKGYVTRDVNDPMNTTKSFKEVYDAPKKAPGSGKFAYIADNLRQAAVVHHDRFESQCKYLVRMIDAWEAVNGAASLPLDWKVNRAMAEEIYKKGVGVGGADQFQTHIKGIINEVAITTHNYHLDRIATELRPVLESLKNVPEGKLTIANLEGHPQLIDELNGLLIGYTNIPEETHQMLMQQFQERIQNADASDSTAEVLKSHVFKHIMEIVQKENRVQTEHIESFRRIRESVKENLVKLVDGVDLAVFLEKVAKGQFETTQLTLEGLRVVRKPVQLNPTEVNRHLELIHALAAEFKWPNEKYAAKVKEYFSSGPDKGLRALEMFQRLTRFSDSSNATPAKTSYVDHDGKTVEVEVKPTRKNLGLQLFVAAIKGGETAGTVIVKGGEWWGHVQNGKDLFLNLDKVFTQSGGMDDSAMGQTQAALFANIINFNNLVSKWQVPSSGVLTSNLVGTLSSNAGAVGIDPAANDELIYSAFKDLAVMYQPHLAGVIALIELGQWGYKDWILTGEKNDILDAMVENGIWEPGNVKELKDLKPGDLPKLKAVRNKEGGSIYAKVELARRDIGDITLIKSKRGFNSWTKMLAIANDGDYLDSDAVLKSSVDALNELSGSYWARKFYLGVLPKSSKDWLKPKLDELGIDIKRSEDDRTTRLDSKQIVITKAQDELPASATQMRLMGYLMADYWIKRQTILEEAVLPKLEKEAARRYLDKLKADEAEAKNYNFMEQVDELYKEVKLIDQKLWPRVARSSAPFPNTVPYDKEKNTPVLDAFKVDDKVKSAVAELLQLQDFLKDPNRSEVDIYDKSIESIVTLSRLTAPKEGKQVLQSLRDYYRKLLDGYGQVHEVLDEGNKLLQASQITVEPFHIKYEPGTWALWALAEGVTNPVRGDLKTSKNWLNSYYSERKRVYRDVAEKTKGSPPGGPLESLWTFVQTALDRDTVDTGGSPAHPLWPKLIKLRYQINLLTSMEEFAADMKGPELREYASKMTIKESVAPKISDADLTDSTARLAFIAKTKQEMEEEYRRLLESLTNLFQIALAVEPAKPYIGQEISAVAAITRDSLQTGGDLNGKTGFPDYVTRFRWTVEDIEGSPVLRFESNEPKWNPKIIKKGFYRVRVEALDKGGNVLAKGFFDGPDAQTLLLWGNVGVKEGDYDGEPVTVTIGNVTEQVTRLGGFSFELKEYNEDLWTSSFTKGQATAVIGGRTFYSTVSEVVNDPKTGLIKLKEDLNLILPYNVAVKVTVLDKAKQVVNGASAEIINSGGAQQPTNGTIKATSATIKAAPGDAIVGLAKYEPFGLSLFTQIVNFSPQAGRAIELKAELPMFDTGHLIAAGRFVPDASISPAPQLTGGQINANIGSGGVEDQGSFTLTNDKPINLQSNPQFEATASVTDGSGKNYLPKVGRITKAIGDVSRLDLGSIEVARLGLTVKPQIELLDWTGRAITASAGRSQVLINGLPAPSNGSVFTGNYTFTDDNEQVMIEGNFEMPDGSQATIQQQIAARDFGGIGANSPQTPSYSLKLPIYLPGSLRVNGRTRIEGVPKDHSAPGFVALNDPKHGLASAPPSNMGFDFTYHKAVYLTENLTISATANDGDISYSGSITAKAPSGAGSLDVGEIVLANGAGKTEETANNEEPPEPVTSAGDPAKPAAGDDEPPEPVVKHQPPPGQTGTDPPGNEAPDPVAGNKPPGNRSGADPAGNEEPEPVAGNTKPSGNTGSGNETPESVPGNRPPEGEGPPSTGDRTGSRGGRNTGTAGAPTGGSGGTGGTTNPGGASGGEGGGSGEEYGNLAGTWLMSGQEGDDYWRVRLPLRPAGKNTWQGEATNDTNIHPCSAERFFTPGFKGSVTIVATGPGVFRFTLRGVNEPCEGNNGGPFEVHWSGTFAGSQMVLRFKPGGEGNTLTRQ